MLHDEIVQSTNDARSVPCIGRLLQRLFKIREEFIIRHHSDFLPQPAPGVFTNALVQAHKIGLCKKQRRDWRPDMTPMCMIKLIVITERDLSCAS